MEVLCSLKLPWLKGAARNEIIQIYTDYVMFNYGACIVVPDGYVDLPLQKIAHTLPKTWW